VKQVEDLTPPEGDLIVDILKNFKVSFYSSGKEPAELVLYFDSGSFYTFIKRSSALKVGRLFELVEPEPFGGLGDGSFSRA